VEPYADVSRRLRGLRGRRDAVELDLTHEEAHLLREVLRSYLKELRGEIVDTENPEYKRTLRHERELLDGIAARLDETPPGEEPTITRVVRVTAYWT
jgi:hypothetical protein